MSGLWLILACSGPDDPGRNKTQPLEPTEELCQADSVHGPPSWMSEEDAQLTQSSVFNAHAVGDLNGDGFEDVAFADSRDYTHLERGGVVHLAYGPPTPNMPYDASIYGSLDHGLFGTAVQGIGDVNGDGRDDLLVGAPGPVEAFGASGAYLFHGPIGGQLLASEADARLIGGNLYQSGCGLSAPGDFDGDGTLDLAVGAGEAEPKGAVALFSGPFEGDVHIPQSSFATLVAPVRPPFHPTGCEFATLPDATGDGLPDLLVAGTYDYGVRPLAWFVPSPIVGDHALESFPAAIGEGGQISVASAGDVDQDGLSDLLVGGWGAWLVHGGLDADLELDTADGIIESDVNLTVSAPGDLNGDGYTDLVVAAPNLWFDAGETAIFFGPVCGTHAFKDADRIVCGTTNDPGMRLGHHLSDLADFDGDGVDDFWVSDIIWGAHLFTGTEL